MGLDCERPYLRAEAPDDSGQALVVCRRVPPLGGNMMPGQGSDGPGWATIRDARGRVAGVVQVDALLALDGVDPVWREATAAIPLSAEFERPSEVSAPLAWLRDRLWRWRALLGFVAPSEAFR